MRAATQAKSLFFSKQISIRVIDHSPHSMLQHASKDSSRSGWFKFLPITTMRVIRVSDASQSGPSTMS